MVEDEIVNRHPCSLGMTGHPAPAEDTGKRPRAPPPGSTGQLWAYRLKPSVIVAAACNQARLVAGARIG